MQISPTNKLLSFGEEHELYDVKVLNEREVRAASGILFLFALTSFLTVWYKGDFLLIKHFIVFFFIDFVIRMFINPRFAPSMILGRLAVNNQVPEYTWATPKRFAWSIGISLAALMLIRIVLMQVFDPLNLIV